jgi:hypothetical protein
VRCSTADPPPSYPDHERRQLPPQAIRGPPPSSHLDQRGGAKPGHRRNRQSSRCPCSRSGNRLSHNQPTKSHRPLARYGAIEKRVSRAASAAPELAWFYAAAVARIPTTVDRRRFLRSKMHKAAAWRPLASPCEQCDKYPSPKESGTWRFR